MKYRVRYYIDFEVEAEAEEEALSQAEEKLNIEFERGVLRITEILESEVELIEQKGVKV